MILEQGNGEMEKKIQAGLCPKCHSQLVDKPYGHDCVICGLQIKDENIYQKGKKDVV